MWLFGPESDIKAETQSSRTAGKVDAGTYSNTCKFMHQFAQSIFLHSSCSCSDLLPMLWNRHPHPLRAGARRLCFSLDGRSLACYPVFVIFLGRNVTVHLVPDK